MSSTQLLLKRSHLPVAGRGYWELRELSSPVVSSTVTSTVTSTKRVGRFQGMFFPRVPKTECEEFGFSFKT